MPKKWDVSILVLVFGSPKLQPMEENICVEMLLASSAQCNGCFGAGRARSSCPHGGWLWGVLGAEGDFWHMEKLAESVRRSVDPPERGAGHRSSDAFLPAPVLFAEDIAMRTGLLFCGEHRHEAGERLQGHRWHAELAVPTCPCSGSLSPPQLAAELRLAPACAVQRRPPTVHRLPSRHHPASPRRHPASPPGFWGTLCGGHAAAVGGVGRKQPLRCLNEVGFFSTPPIHARKNYSHPGICSGRVELKSLSWAWQTSRRSRQLFQGQPWRMRSSRLTLQGEEPCTAGTRPAPLCSCLDGVEGVGGCPVGRMGCRMLQTSSPKSSILQQVFVQSKEEGGWCQRILGSLSPGREGGSWHPAPGCRRQDRSLSSPLCVHGRPLQGTTTKKTPVSCFSHVQPGDISWHPLAVQRPLSPPPRPRWSLHTSRPSHGSCGHPPSPRMPWVVQWWHQEGLGTRHAWPVLGHPSCLPQPRHAPILPRPASTAAVRVISSKSLCASPLISSQELGLARPAERLLFEGTFAAALPPDAQHIAISVPQTSQRHGAHGPYPCPKPSAVEAGGGESARLGREVGEPCQSARLGAGACQAQMGLLVVVKIIQPPLKNPGAATRPHGLRWRRFPPEGCWRLLPLPLPSIPGLGYGATAALHVPPRPLCAAGLWACSFAWPRGRAP